MNNIENINWFSYNELFNLSIQKPEFAQLYITNNCVQNCYFCFNACDNNKKFTDLSLDNWKHIIEQLVKIWVKWLNFSGWEVFLYKDLDHLLSFAKDIWIEKIIINTTWLIDVTKYNFSCFDEVVFSIHWTADIHDMITWRKGNYEILIKNYINFQKMKSKSTIIWINTVITEKNINEINLIYNNHKELWSDYIAFNLGIDSDKIQNSNTETINTINLYMKFINKIPKDKIKFRHGMKHLIWDDTYKYNEKIPLPDCAAGKFKLIVNYKWDVYPCVYFQNDDYHCGNLLKDDVYKIWSNWKWFKIFRDLIYKWSDENCSKCIKKYKCFGWCLAWRFYNIEENKYERDIRCKIGSSFVRDWSNI